MIHHPELFGSEQFFLYLAVCWAFGLSQDTWNRDNFGEGKQDCNVTPVQTRSFWDPSLEAPCWWYCWLGQVQDCWIPVTVSSSSGNFYCFVLKNLFQPVLSFRKEGRTFLQRGKKKQKDLMTMVNLQELTTTDNGSGQSEHGTWRDSILHLYLPEGLILNLMSEVFHTDPV